MVATSSGTATLKAGVGNSSGLRRKAMGVLSALARIDLMEMEPLYKPHGVEERWQHAWEEEGLYNADPDPSREPFVDAHPPPNVTGELHLGHALQLAIGDTTIRWKRMQGYNALFQPGYDHAGISTQNVVEKVLL